ncbi:galactokinase, partial [Streptomyces sp. SID7982]|nr:galactokinase [Streptomyces sp. SID7982]
AAELAVIGRRAENDFVGVPCGIMDQMASACCTEGHALHLDTRDLSLRQVPFDLASQGLTLLVVDTRVKHALGDGAYAERRAGCEEGARLLGIPMLRDLPYEDLA